ncbi:hypothetical protein KR009_005487 [Drosophila setifemur]|nr:hypothetical protein KR009_005487 [Drosophila setifemur]
MHHHHPPLPITGAANGAGTGAAAGGAAAAAESSTAAAPAASTSNSNPNAQQQQQQRRRKKRPNYNYNGIRTVEVRRGYNGFGFTISGQQPCRLSCIISSSPAEQAGLRSGDFLISVNGLNVSKLPHETVVQLIGNSFGSIRMQIAENYYSDSSDEENANATLRGQLLAASLRHKPRFLHHKAKLHRLRNSPQKKLPLPEAVECNANTNAKPTGDHLTLRPVLEDAPLQANHSKSADVANVSAMVRAVGNATLEYRVIVGYLGTIEMPKQISHSSKLQTVRSCIRKLRQEKRQPTIVLMCITPDSLCLQSAGGGVLATYSSARLNFVSSSSESENRFFGLVTSAVHNTQIEEEYEANGGNSLSAAGHISISHSCHVFVIDTKLIEHAQHLQRAHEFRLQCTRDPISNLCLEFPNNSEYVVNLVRSMYTMRILPPASRNVDFEVGLPNAAGGAGAGVAGAAAHSPQPSNHSEISTTTSNSDSGIGFNNDCTNISDRILVVDFLGAGAGAGHAAGPPAHPAPARPLGIVGMPDNRLTVRAMPDPAAHPQSPPGSSSLRRPNLLASFNLIKSPATNLTSTRSCDDVLNLFVDDSPRVMGAVASMDDISLHSAAPSLDEAHTFAHPACVLRKMRRSLILETPSTPHKLSAQVFGQPGSRNSLGFEAIDNIQSSANSACIDQPMDTWASLQNLHKSHKDQTSLSASSSTHCLLEATNSEPDLGNRALPANASPFRRAWGQSSFRTSRSDKVAKQPQGQQGESSPLVRRTASMNASDNDMYIKTLMLDSDLKSTRSQQQLSLLQLPKILTTPAPPSAITASVASEAPAQDNGNPSSWGASFERMLQDAAGMQTFSEFLKKEFSAENIYFWTACERYRLLESEAERAVQAREIFGKHLSNSSSDPVNVDSQARNLTEEKLASAAPDIFAPAQKQIFNLMKFDSYQRFIRSDLFKSCVEAEQKGQALPYNGSDLDELLKTNFHLAASSKLKKSASNAEDRRRKSLLPWHRKTRSKSRDRTEIMADLQSSLMPAPPLPPPTLLTSASLKLASGQNSLSDLHSSRSSLSSFDAGAPNGAGASVESVCSLCRVILTDGATTIVQTRAGETVGQLVERLLEKRNLVYPYYDIVFQGTTKSIDLQQPSQLLAGKEVLIERRVAFKLDLPDPKVISVKSKPKKQLHEVIRPILTKYNYKMEQVQVIMRDTQMPMDLQQPVTMADGQRLRIVMLQSDFQAGGGSSSISSMPPKQIKPMKPLPSPAAAQLDELTNKMFNEMLASKAEAAERPQPQRPSDLCSMKSNEAPSETSSSLFDRMRCQRQQQRDNIPGSKLPKLKKKSTSSQQSEEALSTPGAGSVSVSVPTPADPKKPIIAKLKAGVKLQVTERVAEHQDELLEGLKRAQQARLEDQRGTEINFDLPDFLKNKENLSAAVSKLRKVRANLSPVSKAATTPTEIPQPAPRFSITRNQQPVSPMKVDTPEPETEQLQLSAETALDQAEYAKAPPPLPPKPKVLPIKPSNWGVAVSQPTSNYSNKFSPPGKKQGPTSPKEASAAAFVSKIPLELGRKSLEEAGSRCAYLDEPSSSFV